MAKIIKLRGKREYLYPLPGASNTHTDHYHVGDDGTILSIVVGGSHEYSRQEVRKHIEEVTGMSFPPTDYSEE